MKFRLRQFVGAFVAFFSCVTVCVAQVNVSGVVKDETGEPLIGANVVLFNTSSGNVTDIDGNFVLEVPSLPTRLVISYIGYANDTVEVTTASAPLQIQLGDNATVITTVEITGRRISEKRQQSALTMETLDNIAIRETPAANFYDGLGALKDVDLTAASLGFKIINTRGFNSTNPVRSLQIIDGVDNQSPGLNFSLGNFLGASDLDVNSVNIIVGASSAFYGPNAFNGVISMETKDPFLQQGLSATIKGGERSLVEGGFRWAQAVKNKAGREFFAYKLNAYGFRADDWQADNYDPITDGRNGLENPGGYDAVNIYGDEYNREFNLPRVAGLNTFYRRGYREKDLVNYKSENLKASAAFHYRFRPDLELSSPELIATTSYSTGTTIYQGDNRFSLRGIQFFQHKLEFRKRDNYFLRAYATHEDAGNSYDPYFTALLLIDSASTSTDFARRYRRYWEQGIRNGSGDLEGNYDDFFSGMEGFPRRSQFPGDPDGYQRALDAFISPFQDSLFLFHDRAQNFANTGDPNDPEVFAFFEPGSPEFKTLFNNITSTLSSQPFGTQLYDRSALFHVHGEKMFNDVVKNAGSLTDLDLRVGSNYRLYTPNSRGTVLQDTAGRNIDTYEYGVYGGGTATFVEKIKVAASLRLDKNKNFNYLLSPAASVVYSPTELTTFRVSLSSAIRNPTLADQYLNYNVGRATLLGNLNGFDSLATTDGVIDYLNNASADRNVLGYFSVDPIRPEQVRTIETGIRTTLFEKIFVDATYYYSQYKDFIGYIIGADVAFQPGTGRVTGVDVYRVSANAADRVTTQGFSIGGNYYFQKYYALSANYSWNILNTQTDDPIIPAFNTPEHKYNIGLAARDIPYTLFGEQNVFGFNSNYKWVQGFIFEGSPQFTGFIPSYGLLDLQVNTRFPQLSTTLKIGASNLLNNKIFQTYGGPRIGRLAYASLTYELRKR